MDNFTVNLTIEDIFCGNCCKEVKERNVIITSTNQTVTLQCNYILNVIFVSSSYFTVLIQNGTQVIIRNIYTNFTSSICLPNQCGKHFVNISGTIEQT